MSDKRDRHLLANETDEIRFSMEEERRIYENNKHKSKAPSNPWIVRRAGSIPKSANNTSFSGGFRNYLEEGCLWEVAKYILVPVVLACFVGILKACSL